MKRLDYLLMAVASIVRIKVGPDHSHGEITVAIDNAIDGVNKITSMTDAEAAAVRAELYRRCGLEMKEVA